MNYQITQRIQIVFCESKKLLSIQKNIWLYTFTKMLQKLNGLPIPTTSIQVFLKISFLLKSITKRSLKSALVQDRLAANGINKYKDRVQVSINFNNILKIYKMGRSALSHNFKTIIGVRARPSLTKLLTEDQSLYDLHKLVHFLIKPFIKKCTRSNSCARDPKKITPGGLCFMSLRGDKFIRKIKICVLIFLFEKT